jgi:hypothetical protein
VWNDGRTGQNKKKRATTQVNFSTMSSRAFSPFIFLNTVFPTGIAERQRGSGERNLNPNVALYE